LVKSLFPWEVISLHLLGAPYLNVPSKYFFHLFMDENEYLGNQTLNLWAKGKSFNPHTTIVFLEKVVQEK
jgi:hypothetical protein